MFTINIKGERNPKNIRMVKLQMIFYKKGYTRVSKVLYISGLFSEWIQKEQSFNENNPDNRAKNKLLLKERLRYLRIAEKWESEDKDWIPVELSHYYDKEKESRDRYAGVSRILDILYLKISSRERFKNGRVLNCRPSAERYKCLKNMLERFTRSKYKKEFSRYLFRDINETFLYDFIQYSKEQGRKNGNKGNIKEKLRSLHSLCAYAKQLHIHNVNLSAFYLFRSQLKPEKTISKAISKERMLQIERTDRSLLKRKEELYLDLFMFSFYAGGMSNIDVCFLERSSIKGDIISFERIKCDKTVQIILIDKARQLIEKYKDKGYMDYVFPILKANDITQKQMYDRVKKVSIGVNKVLKAICTDLGVKERVTWGTARSSFISRMVDEGYHPLQIAEQVGNSPNMIYRYYYTITDCEKVKEHMNRVL